MDTLIALIAKVWTVLQAIKDASTNYKQQLDAANATIANLQAQLANVPSQVTAAQEAQAAAEKKAADDQAELDALHAQADQAAADVQAHLDQLTGNISAAPSDQPPADQQSGNPI